MTELERLLAIEDIKSLKARYFRCLDTKDFQGLRKVFAVDAVFDVGAAMEDPVLGAPPDALAMPAMEGLEAIITGVEAVLRDAQSVHHGHMPEIEVTSEQTARGVWAMEDLVRTSDFELWGYGHYHETYEKTDGHWLIKTLKLTRLRVTVK